MKIEVALPLPVKRRVNHDPTFAKDSDNPELEPIPDGLDCELESGLGLPLPVIAPVGTIRAELSGMRLPLPLCSAPNDSGNHYPWLLAAA